MPTRSSLHPPTPLPRARGPFSALSSHSHVHPCSDASEYQVHALSSAALAVWCASSLSFSSGRGRGSVLGRGSALRCGRGSRRWKDGLRSRGARRRELVKREVVTPLAWLGSKGKRKYKFSECRGMFTLLTHLSDGQALERSSIGPGKAIGFLYTV